MNDPNIAEIRSNWELLKSQIKSYNHCVTWEGFDNCTVGNPAVVRISTEWDHDHRYNDDIALDIVKSYTYDVEVTGQVMWDVWVWFIENKIITDFYWRTTNGRSTDGSDFVCDATLKFKDSNLATMFKMRFG